MIVKPLPPDQATPRQKDAIIGLVYHHSPVVTPHSDMKDVLEAVEHLTGITIDKWESLDKKTASNIISNLMAKP